MNICLQCDKQIGIIVNELDKNATTQGIKGFRCVECNEMNYMCQVCYYKWYDEVPSPFHTEHHYQSFVRDIHFTKFHSSVDIV